MNTKEAKLCYEIALLSKRQAINAGRGIDEKFPEKARLVESLSLEEKIEKLTDELICLGLDQYEE
tara:strand:+ start:149 stop:343 length:195 start_codon:yes stop_codon:yes gene_type:complete